MSAVTLPVQLEERLVTINSETHSNRVASLIQQLSHAVATNGKVLLGVQHAIRDIQKSLEDSNEQHRKQMLVEACRREDLQKQADLISKRVEVLESTVSRKADVDDAVVQIQKELRKSTEFIHEMEQGNGERVNKFVSGYIESFIPKWFAGVSATMMKNISNMIHDTADQASVDLERRTMEAEEKAQAALMNLQNSLTSTIYINSEERRKEIRQLRTDVFERFIEGDERFQRLMEVERASVLRRQRKARRRLHSLEQSTTALQTTLCLEDQLCRELHNLMVSQSFEDVDPRSMSLLVATIPDEVVDSDNDGANEPGPQHLPHDSAFFHTLPINEAVTDIRVRRVAQTPHLVALRGVTQREFTERIDFLRSDVHNDLVAEIFDLQREVRGKVGTNKLGELLDQFRDEQLYTNVKMLMTDMNDVKNNKIDAAMFIEGLRSKADIRLLEMKMDKLIFSQNIESVERKIEDLAGAAGRHEVRLGRVENLAHATHRKSLGNSLSRLDAMESSATMLEEGRGGSPSASKQRRGTTKTGPGALSWRTEGSSPSTDVSVLKDMKGAALVNQIVENFVPVQLTVPESTRDLTKLQINTVKSLHEKQVRELASASALMDPVVEPFSSPDPHSGHTKPSASAGRDRTSNKVSSARPSRTPSAQQHGHPTRHSPEQTPPPPAKPSTPQPTSRMNLIPMTPNQEAYCQAVDDTPPITNKKDVLSGVLKVGEKR